MPEFEILSDTYFLMVVSGTIGVLLTWLGQRVLNKRGTFSYGVTHNRVGASVEHPVFGKISVSWNDLPISNLFFSTLELKNDSLNDYENVLITVFSSTTDLLSESTNIVGTPYSLGWSADYQMEMFVEPEKTASELQRQAYTSRREYVIPVFNRSQVARFSYLNASKAESGPEIWMSTKAKGVELKFRTPAQQILGVPAKHASFAGTVAGLALLIPLVLSIKTPWLLALIALLYGLVAQIPGALLVKGLRSLRRAIGN